MKKKIIGGLALFLILVCVFSYGFVQYLFKRAVPQTEGKLVLSGLTSEVLVYRDSFGIPHIEAQNQLDLYRALGYVQASERLFQLDLYRRASRGQLAEVFGPLALEKDKLTRTLNLMSPMDHPARVPLSEEARKYTQAYLDGMNEFIKTGTLPIEFVLIGYEPEMFELKDAYAFLGYMAFLFGNAPKQDPLFEKFKDFYSEETIALMGNEIGTPKREVVSEVSLEPLYNQDLIYLPPVDGSNAWLVAGNRTESGIPIFANDPHVGISLPGLWFEAHIKSPTFELYGHFLPLNPFAAIGHNKEKAWGMTISYGDDMDFYKESVDWNQKTIVYRGEKKPLKKVEHTINVKGQSPEKFVSWIGPHGPLLGKASEKGLSKPEYALQWTHHHKDNRPLEAGYAMNYAKNIDEMRLAVTLGTAPGLNIMYADKENIAWWMYGAIPIRPEGMQGDGVYPGESGEFDWHGHLTPDEKPQMENPPVGIIVSANGRPPGAPKSVKGYWQPQDRAQTIFEKLSERKKWSVEEIKKLQVSNENNIAPRFFKKLKKFLGPEVLKGTVEKEALKVVDSWNGDSRANSAGALIYHDFTWRLNRQLFDELPEEDYMNYCRVNASWRSFARFSDLPNHEIWDLKSTSEKEQMRHVVQKSFKETVKELTNKFGADVSKWEWGSYHQVEFRHPVGRKGGILKKIFNLGPYPVDGSYNSINNFRKLGCRYGFSVGAGPSTRIVVPMKDTLNTWGGLPLGTSAHHHSPYFSNERKDFLEGRHRPQLMDWKKIKNYSKLTFSPSP